MVTPSLYVGGGQRYISEIANYWDKLNHDITVIVLCKKDVFYKLSPTISIIKLKSSNNGKVGNPYVAIKTIVELRKTIKALDPIFTLSILGSINILTIISTFNLKTKVFIRDAFSPSRKRGFFEGLGRKYLYKKANGIIAQTEEIKLNIEKESRANNVNVIGNPVRDIEMTSFNKRDKIVLNIGALIPRKGQKYFIKACSQLKSQGWKFVILGEGNYRKNLESIISENDLGDCVKLIGNEKNVDKWLKRSSIFVFPSLLEGLPNALIEAMAAGLACVSFDCETGPRDLIIDNENGFLVPIGDFDQLKLKIRTLMDDDKLRLKFSTNANITSKRYKSNVIGEKVLEFCTNTSFK